MDEPASALDPIATFQIEDLIQELADTAACNKLKESATPGVTNICTNVQPAV